MPFGFFKTRENKPMTIHLEENEMFKTQIFHARGMNRKNYFIADADYYVFLKRDGEYLGYPRYQGGRLYLFSPNPLKQGSRSEKNSYQTAQVTAIQKDFLADVEWGTPLQSLWHIEDPLTKEPYWVGGHGIFEVKIEPDDAGLNATKLYRRLLKPYPDFTTEHLKERLRTEFTLEVGAAVERMMIMEKRSLANYVGLGPNDLKKVSTQILPTIGDIFAKYGLTITGFVLEGLQVHKTNRPL